MWYVFTAFVITIADDFLVGAGKTVWLRNHKARKPTDLTPYLASLPWFVKDSNTSADDFFIWNRVFHDSPHSSPSFIDS